MQLVFLILGMVLSLFCIARVGTYLWTFVSANRMMTFTDQLKLVPDLFFIAVGFNAVAIANHFGWINS